jgi:transcriptional regulator
MFVPGQYRQPDDTWLVEIARKNPLALMLTNGDGAVGPYATHLAVILPRSPPMSSWPADLAGSTMLGHMNRANPHWRALHAGIRSVLVFTGPHGYVSPSVYGYDPAAPTWNYTAVHVHGAVHPIDSPEETMDVVWSTARTFESDFGAGRDMSGSIDYFRRILPGVGAFRFTVSKAEGMFKLSQEQDPQVRERVREHFAGQDSCHYRAAADLMKRLT